MEREMISIIVPVYNTEKYLKRCLDSIISQTYKHIEIIIIDDGSTDRSGEICEEYAAKDDRIILIRGKNQGIVRARNTGLRYAHGKWIGWTDSDDWIAPDMFEYLMSLAQEYSADVVQCGLSFDYCDYSKTHFLSPDVHKAAKPFTKQDWELFSNQLYNKLYRKELIEQLEFEPFPIGEDLVFNIETISSAKTIVFGTETKYHYVQRNDSVCNRPPDMLRFSAYRDALEFVLSKFDHDSLAYRHFEAEYLRNDLDMCSKLVRFHIPSAELWKQRLLREIKTRLAKILSSKLFTPKEKLKFYLIAKHWSIYQTLLLAAKGMHG